MSDDEYYGVFDPDEIDLSHEVCPDCYGDSDPVDDLFYCGTCKGRGWVYGEMLSAPHLTHYQCERLAQKRRHEVAG